MKVRQWNKTPWPRSKADVEIGNYAEVSQGFGLFDSAEEEDEGMADREEMDEDELDVGQSGFESLLQPGDEGQTLIDSL